MDRRIDLLRVTACFMVVLLHISGANIHEFGPKWWGANVWDSLSRACVPLFFMISGATLLPKSESLPDFFRKRASRIVLPLLTWSAFYLWWLQRNGVDTGNWVLAILRGPTMFHLWYFYAIIGFYLFMPVMRRFYQGSTSAERIFFLVVCFLVSSAYPTIQSLYLDKDCGYLRLGLLADVYYLQYFGGYVGYMFLGAFLHECKSSFKSGIAVYAVATAGTILATYFLSKKIGAPCEFFYLYLSPLVVLAAAGLFMAFMGLRGGPSSKALRIVSDSTLGIYGLHVFMIDPIFMRKGLIEISGSSWLDPVLATVGVFVACLVVIATARLIKPVRYLT
jgi:surface polysaccharide O-acyltransferase-like enzyme